MSLHYAPIFARPCVSDLVAVAGEKAGAPSWSCRRTGEAALAILTKRIRRCGCCRHGACLRLLVTSSKSFRRLASSFSCHGATDSASGAKVRVDSASAPLYHCLLAGNEATDGAGSPDSASRWETASDLTAIPEACWYRSSRSFSSALLIRPPACAVSRDSGAPPVARSSIQYCFEDESRCIAPKRCRVPVAIVHHRTEGEQVGTGIQLFTLGLLRRHISHGAHHRAPDRSGAVHPSCPFVCLADAIRLEELAAGETFARPKSQNLGVATFRRKDVCRLYISMNDTL